MKLSVLLFFLLHSLRAFAEFPLWDEPSRTFKQEWWEFQSQLTYFQATSNYTREGGSYTSLPAGSDYHLMTIDFGAHYGLTKKWGAFVTSQVASAESKTSGTSITETRSTSSLTQIVGGTDYLFYTKGNTELFADLALTIPFKKVTAQSNEVLNNEGAMEFAARLVARQQWRSLGFFAFAGYIYRDEGRSGLFPYGGGGEWNLNSFGLGAELRGFQSVVNDQYSSDPSRRQAVAVKNGHSLKFYSVDPSLLETHLWIRSNSKDQLTWKAGGGMTLTGASAAGGWNLFLGLGYNFSPNFIKPSEPKLLQPKPEIERFQEDITDEANQNYFTKPAPPPVPKPGPPNNQKQQIQNDLNQLEFQIELKRMKPKKPKKKRPRSQ